MNVFVEIIFGWPAAIAALLLCILGVGLKRYWLVVTGALVSLPFHYYIFGTPRFSILGILLPLCLFASAYAVRRKIYFLAWLLLLPFTGFILWLGVIILRA